MLAIPAPGGKVGFGRFAVLSLGVATGLYVYTSFISPKIDDKYENYSLGPVSSGMVMAGATGLIMAALFSMAFSSVAK